MQVEWLVAHQKLSHNIAATIVFCSVLHNILPPWNWDPDFVREGLADFPLAQKWFHAVFNNRYYKLIVYIIGYIALNARSTLWRSISITNPKGVNGNVTNGKVDKPNVDMESKVG